MVTIYTENGDSIDIILCGECGATGGGRRGAQRTAVTELWRTFVREKFNSIPFINIKTSPIIFCQNCSALNFLSVIYLISCIMRMSKQHNAAWSILHVMLLYSVLPWCCVSCMPVWIFTPSPRSHKKHHFTSFLCHFRPWDGVKSYLFVENISSDYIRKENESITFVRDTHPNQKTLSPSQTHIFWQLNRGETFPFLDLVLCCKRK